jgi:asparaginyl-tRNA synthetase
MTCDLIAPYGFGEILGVAEKITDPKELTERMHEKRKTTQSQLERYKWYGDLRKYGLPPHGGIGMGIERAVRYLLHLPNVKDLIPFPRLYRRRID